MAIQEFFTQLGSVMAAFMFVSVAMQKYLPFDITFFIEKYTNKLASYFNPHIQITFREFTGNHMAKSQAYVAIRDYLSATVTSDSKRLKADYLKKSKSLVLSMADYEEVCDEYNGIKVWWTSLKHVPSTNSISMYPSADEKRYYELTFHRRHREIITKDYIQHILKIGKAIALERRQRKLYTNNPSSKWDWDDTRWSHIVFKHPATFETLAMATKKKEEIMKDLVRFSKGKEYYARIGKAWKRGYLLYGPPGTGKSTMIAAMANFLNYDIYDLELTAVKDNSDLRRLLIETTSKSIIVIEDIDCSLNLTGQRKDCERKTDVISKLTKKDDDDDDDEDEKKNKSKVTLSGLLNFIDGIWSACGGERIIIFTTNFVEKLDPALIRRGRMDKHIEMSYCCFEAFKVLAKNYLDIEKHELFGRIEELLQDTNMSPADVAENLMPKAEDEEVEICLKNLINELEAVREEATKKALQAEKEARLKAKKDNKEKELSSGNRKCIRRCDRK